MCRTNGPIGGGTSAVAIGSSVLARSALGDYIAPGSRDAVATVDRLIELLDNQDIEAALIRVD